MPDLFETLRSWVGAAAQGPARVPVWKAIDNRQVDRPLAAATLQAGRDYFEVRVVRVNLAAQRRWFDLFTPVVFAATEFSYDGQDAITPVVVGPGLLRQIGADVPLTQLLTGTRITGPVPYSGGGITITLVLHQLQAGNVAQPFLDALEGASKALDFAAGLLPYTAVARVVLSALSSIVGGSKPLLAVRDARAKIATGYWALLDPAGDSQLDDLSVQDRELFAATRPLRDHDYLLCSVSKVDPDEVDITRLPLYRQWHAVLLEAAKSSTSDVWQSAKTNMAALVGMMLTSPDLTLPHAAKLRDEWLELLVASHEEAVRLSNLGEGQLHPQPSPFDPVRTDTLAVLNL